LLTFVATTPDLARLVDALEDKYALVPERAAAGKLRGLVRFNDGAARAGIFP